MSWSFNLKRDPASGLPPEGVYRFVVESSDPKPGGDKGPILSLRLRLYVRGVKHNSSVFDNLPTSEESRWKVDQFFNAVGAPAEGEALPPWFVGKSGYAKFANELSRDGEMRAVVKRYLTTAAAEALIEKLARSSDGDDTVPSPRSRPPVAEGASPSRSKTSKKPAELDTDDEASPF